MISNFFIIAIRNLRKHKVFSFINIFGLALGIAASLMILQYARYELSYDRFEPNAGRIYRLQLDRYHDGKLATRWAAGATGIGPAVKDALPEVESFARLAGSGSIVSYKDKEFREKRIFFTNDAFLSMFSYPALQGTVNGALKDIFTAVITASTARKYFGAEDPLGKMISMNKRDFFKVTAVVPDPPANTHLKFDILLSWATLLKWRGPELETRWNWDGFFNYILVRPGTDPKQLEKKIASVVQAKWGEEMKSVHEGMVFHLQALPDIHLYSNYMFEAEVNGDGKSVYFLLAIAVFIIVIAWINYINLATARSIERAKEVGVRKVLGSLRRQLINQFLFESLLINGLAVILAFLLILACLPLFNAITGKELHFSLFKDPLFWAVLAGLFITGTFLSGLYPAFVLSSFKPIAVLKGKLSKTGHGAFLRQSLVIIQFIASVILMVGTFAVYRQLHFMQHQDLGVQISQTLVIKGPGVLDSTYTAKLSGFKTEALRLPGVQKMSLSTEVPGNKVGWNAGGIRLVGSDPTTGDQYRIIGIDHDFLDAFGLKLLKGRNFYTGTADSLSVLFNEAATKKIGFKNPEDAINKRIEFWGRQYTIVGVVSNHHQESLRQDYDAHIFRYFPDANSYYSLKLTASQNNWSELVSAVQNQWKTFFPGNPFEYFFLDDHFADQYKADRQFGQTFGLFAGLAIFVSCLGLLGLAAFVTNQRTKEIGVRKIVGASISSILLLLTKDFIRPVLIAFVIAIPITWYLLKKWLDNYAFRITISPWLFILPGLLILAIAILAVSTQTLRAASANPSKSLRTE
ncbi:MAG TPA: ABC transporter permease [Puia sp.]|jgi:putative ABC transport system permease protein